MLRTTFALLLLLTASARSAHGFACLENGGHCLFWAGHAATLRLFLGSPGTALLNGTFTWDENGVNAADDWNGADAAFHYSTEVGGNLFEPCGPRGPGHACTNTGPAGDNPVVFVDDACGGGFGDIVAQTTNCFDVRDQSMINAPVFVNQGAMWNAYDGPLRPPINDIRRVLLHEFGHVLGLDHPDGHGQTVGAIMNSRESNFDRLRPDDIAGLFSIYPNGAPSGSGAAPTSGCQIAGSSSSGGGWLLLIPAGIVWVLRQRSARGLDNARQPR